MRKITSVTAVVLIVVTLLTSLFSVDTLAKKNVATKKTPNYKLTVKIDKKNKYVKRIIKKKIKNKKNRYTIQVKIKKKYKKQNENGELFHLWKVKGKSKTLNERTLFLDIKLESNCTYTFYSCRGNEKEIDKLEERVSGLEP